MVDNHEFHYFLEVVLVVWRQDRLGRPLKKKVELNQMTPEAQVLRSLLISAASQLFEGVKQIPGTESVAAFRSGYFAGRSVAEISQ